MAKKKYLYGSNCVKQCFESGSGLDPDPSWEFGSGSRRQNVLFMERGGEAGDFWHLLIKKFEFLFRM
jgi:hypothetical protein